MGSWKWICNLIGEDRSCASCNEQQASFPFGTTGFANEIRKREALDLETCVVGTGDVLIIGLQLASRRSTLLIHFCTAIDFSESIPVARICYKITSFDLEYIS